MDYYKAILQHAQDVGIEPGQSSYFSNPQTILDPRLFTDGKLIPSVRNSILSTVLRYFDTKYGGAEAWSHTWLAGSGVSHLWAAERNPADLDCLIGVDFAMFRKDNPEYKWFSNRDIAAMINEGFRADVYPATKNFLGAFELTFYVNVKANIVDIKPYAAYSLTNNEWTVEPTDLDVQQPDEWTVITDSDVFRATETIARYTRALQELKSAVNPAVRRNAETALTLAVEQGAALFDEIHEARGAAFGEQGLGYADFTNFRWQAGKQTGIVPALKKLKDVAADIKKTVSEETYGIELPDASILVRRAASQYMNR
jgi:hypothetical protein